MGNQTVIKIHISRDFSFAEFDATIDPITLEGMPTSHQILQIWERLPSKDQQPRGANGLFPDSHNAKIEARRERREEEKAAKRREPPATANQRRVLERYGEWQDGLTAAEASKKLTELGI